MSSVHFSWIIKSENENNNRNSQRMNREKQIHARTKV